MSTYNLHTAFVCFINMYSEGVKLCLHYLFAVIKVYKENVVLENYYKLCQFVLENYSWICNFKYVNC